MILVIDDDISIRTSLSLMLKHAKFEVQAVSSPKEAMAVVRSTAPELILMDMNFSLTTSGDEGITLLKQVKIFRPEVPVILMTAWGSIQLAVKGMQAGASDFITKPWHNAVLMERIETALALKKKEKEEEEKEEETPKTGSGFDRSHIIGKSKALMEVLKTIKRVSNTNASVLITGESGTGKELIAEAVHRNSPRAKNAFVKVNLGGISQSLFESEMFGHKKGAFTDATSDRVGRFTLADKGTIFLDEIGELDLACQVKLLRVLQEQKFEVLGDSTTRTVNIRVVSATNADLPKMVQERTFREDLFYRINLITVHLPALRERREDIPLLVRHFADLQCKQNGLPAVDFTPDAMEYLQRLPYPGNIRELKNLVERTILVSGKEMLNAEDFKTLNPVTAEPEISMNLNGLTLDEMERQRILQALEKYDNNVSQAAADLGLSRPALYRRMEKHHITI